MAHIRQSRPGLGFQVTVRKTFEGVASSLGSGWVVDLAVPRRVRI